MKKILFGIGLIGCIVSIGLGVYAGVIPNLYLGILGGGYFILLVLLFILRKSKGKVSGFISGIVFIVLLGCVTGSSFLFIRADKFLSNISAAEQEVSSYSVVVLKSSKYEELDDIKGLEMGTTTEGNDSYSKALKKLKEKVSGGETSFSNSYELMNALLDEKIEVIFISDATISILSEGIDDLENKIRVIDTVAITEEVLKSDDSVDKKVEALDSAFNIYISGIDTYGAIGTVSRSDVNIVATINPNTSKILLTSVPRDMYVQLAGTTGLKDKLTHAGVYGIDMSIKTLENFLDIDLNYYVRINFNSLIALVDYLGGIDVESDYEFTTGGRTYYKGINYNLSGKDALAFSRNRYAFVDGDRQRGRNQEKVIEAIIGKVTSSKDANTYLNLLNTLEKSFQTNMSKEFMQNLIKKQIEGNYKWNVVANDVNGSDHMDYTYSYPWQKLYVMLVDEDSLTSAKAKIKEVMDEE